MLLASLIVAQVFFPKALEQTALADEPLPEREVQLQEGKRLFGENNMIQAGACFRRAVQLAPQNPHVHFWLGLVLDQSGDSQGALNEYKLSLELAQSIKMDCAELRIDQANARTKLLPVLGQSIRDAANSALGDYQRSIVIDPGNALAYLGLTKCLLDSGDYDGALKSLQKFIDLGGRDNVVPLLRGLALAGQGNFNDARNDLNIFLDSNQMQSRTPSNQSDARNTPYATAGGGIRRTVNPALLDLARKVLNEIEPVR